MAQLNYAPTKTNLLKLRSDLKFAQQGYELLDQKRNILIIELLALVDQESPSHKADSFYDTSHQPDYA